MVFAMASPFLFIAQVWPVEGKTFRPHIRHLIRTTICSHNPGVKGFFLEKISKRGTILQLGSEIFPVKMPQNFVTKMIHHHPHMFLPRTIRPHMILPMFFMSPYATSLKEPGRLLHHFPDFYIPVHYIPIWEECVSKILFPDFYILV